MSITNFPTKLYVVQPMDTIDSILKKTKMNKEDFYALNPILRISNLKTGQPLLIKNDFRSEESINSCDCQLLFLNHAFLVKQLVIDKIFIDNYSPVIKKELNENSKNLLPCIEQYVKIDGDFNLDQLLQELQNLLEEFIEISKNGNKEDLLSLNKKLNFVLESIKQLGIEDETKTVIENIVKDWEFYIIKLLMNNFEEAENKYKSIQNQYISISKTI